MKWTANSKIAAEPSISAQIPQPSDEATVFPNDFFPSEKKRKFVGGVDATSPNEQVSESTRATFVKSGKTLRTAMVRCPRMAKRMRKEFLVLHIQMAMISDDDGDRPIHVAVAHEDLRLVQKLCALMKRASISLDITNYLRQTPLHLAVMLGNAEIVKLLVHYGASLTLRDRNGNSVLHLAVKAGTKKDVFCLILSHPQVKNILNILDHEGYSALHRAVFKKNSTAVDCLTRCGADINAVDGKSGRSSLIHAILDENLEMVNLLLKRGACSMKVDYSGHSAFDLALQTANKRILKLIEKGMSRNNLDVPAETDSVSNNIHVNIPPDVNSIEEETCNAMKMQKISDTEKKLSSKNEIINVLSDNGDNDVITVLKKKSHRTKGRCHVSQSNV